MPEPVKKLAFVWDWDNPLEYLVHWEDGLAAALNQLKDKFELKVYTQIIGIERETVLNHKFFKIHCYPTSKLMEEQILRDAPDIALFWADFTRPAIQGIASRIPSAICFAGGSVDSPNTHFFKRIFVESQSYYDELNAKGYPVSRAFGANTTLFAPHSQPKMFDVLFPACFAAWKRWELFSSSADLYRSYACGWYQEHEAFCYESCQRANILTTRHVPPYLLSDYYNATHCVLVTSQGNGGSQRTVLEALATNVPCIVMADSDKTSELVIAAGRPDWVVEPNVADIRKKIDEILANPPVVNTREFILKNYSEFSYAEKLYQGLCALS